MRLLDVVLRAGPSVAWAEGDGIPWNDPEFSARMLREHLSQEHDRASRREETVARQVAWMHHFVLEGRPDRILDLACGPGLYTARLAALGHDCVGIDFAPAAVAYAARTAQEQGLRCAYRLDDVRTAGYGAGFGLALMIFGQMNAFRPEEARAMLRRARGALTEGGLLLLETHTFAAVRAMGEAPPVWRTVERGVFSDRPHLRLQESFWDDDRRAAVCRYFIVDAETAAVTAFTESVQAYRDEEFSALLRDCGFAVRGVFPALDGSDAGGDFMVWLAAAAEHPIDAPAAAKDAAGD